MLIASRDIGTQKTLQSGEWSGVSELGSDSDDEKERERESELQLSY